MTSVRITSARPIIAAQRVAVPEGYTRIKRIATRMGEPPFVHRVLHIPPRIEIVPAEEAIDLIRMRDADADPWEPRHVEPDEIVELDDGVAHRLIAQGQAEAA